MYRLKAPFPYFGGKSRAADLVWERLGPVRNYVEPFAGSLAVLLAREKPPGGLETVNDADSFISNFWRAVRLAPEETAKWADWPVSETEIIARSKWLVRTGAKRLELCKEDPEFYDAKVAGWWVWGLCSWIGCDFLRRTESLTRKLPNMATVGIHRRTLLQDHQNRQQAIKHYFAVLSERLRDVRIACGDWTRVLTPSVTTRIGVTGILLDPPYSSAEYGMAYRVQGGISGDVAKWAAANGDDPLIRIALCGYEGEHTMPRGWTCVSWKANGGYGNQGHGRGRANANRERIWFSPHCLKPEKARRAA